MQVPVGGFSSKEQHATGPSSMTKGRKLPNPPASGARPADPTHLTSCGCSRERSHLSPAFSGDDADNVTSHTPISFLAVGRCSEAAGMRGAARVGVGESTCRVWSSVERPGVVASVTAFGTDEYLTQACAAPSARTGRAEQRTAAIREWLM